MTRRSLLPREHGAYVQLLAPLAAALLAFGATPAAVLLAVGATLAFAANEPLLVALGHRGRRMREQDGLRARRMLGVLVPIALVAGVTGLVLAPHALAVAAVVAGPAGVLVLLVWRKQERSLAGELVAAVALAGAAAPVAIAAGAQTRDALLVWIAWAIGYAFTVVAVHRVIARHKRAPLPLDRVLAATAVVLTGAIAAVSGALDHARIALPLAAGASVVLLVAPAATHLRAIGFAMLGLSVVSLAVVVYAHA